MTRKYDIETVQKLFASSGCEFLDKVYVNKDFRHNFRCSCGTQSKISLSNFIRGTRCGCGREKVKYNLEQVKEYFKKHDCEFLDDHFFGSKVKHKFKCSCGAVAYTRLHNFIKGHRCGCKTKSSYERMDLLTVQNYFKSRGMQFLDACYYGVLYDHKVRCSCGLEFNIRLINLLKRKNACTHQKIVRNKSKSNLTMDS